MLGVGLTILFAKEKGCNFTFICTANIPATKRGDYIFAKMQIINRICN